MSEPELLVIGHVTCDDFGGSYRLGGAAGYAALAGVALGIPTALVTVAKPDSPLLAALRNLPGLSLSVSPDEKITTFALDYSGPRRRLIVRATARPLVLSDVPAAWRSPRAIYVGTVIGECTRALVDALSGGHTIAALQGWLRHIGPDGTVGPTPTLDTFDPPSSLDTAVLSEEDHASADELAERLALTGVTVAVTRGSRGATILQRGQRLEIPAVPAQEVDPTGAGDVFGLVLGLARAAGFEAAVAGRYAAQAAARVVEGPGLGRLAECDLGELRRRWWQRI